MSTFCISLHFEIHCIKQFCIVISLLSLEIMFNIHMGMVLIQNAADLQDCKDFADYT